MAQAERGGVMTGMVVVVDGSGGPRETPLEQAPLEQVRLLAQHGSLEAAREYARRTSRATLGGEERTTE